MLFQSLMLMLSGAEPLNPPGGELNLCVDVCIISPNWGSKLERPAKPLIPTAGAVHVTSPGGEYGFWLDSKVL